MTKTEVFLLLWQSRVVIYLAVFEPNQLVGVEKRHCMANFVMLMFASGNDFRLSAVSKSDLRANEF